MKYSNGSRNSAGIVWGSCPHLSMVLGRGEWFGDFVCEHTILERYICAEGFGVLDGVVG